LRRLQCCLAGPEAGLCYLWQQPVGSAIYVYRRSAVTDDLLAKVRLAICMPIAWDMFFIICPRHMWTSQRPQSPHPPTGINYDDREIASHTQADLTRTFSYISGNILRFV